MAKYTYQSDSDDVIDIPAYSLHVASGDTVEIPDSDTSFDGRPGFTRAKTPTAPAPAEASESTPPATTTTN